MNIVKCEPLIYIYIYTISTLPPLRGISTKNRGSTNSWKLAESRGEREIDEDKVKAAAALLSFASNKIINHRAGFRKERKEKEKRANKPAETRRHDVHRGLKKGIAIKIVRKWTISGLQDSILKSATDKGAFSPPLPPYWRVLDFSRGRRTWLIAASETHDCSNDPLPNDVKSPSRYL